MAEPTQPGLVQVVNPRGELTHIAEADLPAALDAKGGYRLPTSQETQLDTEQNMPGEKGRYETLREKGYNPLVAGVVAAGASGGMGGAWREAGIEGATGGLLQAGIAKGLDAVNPNWAESYTKDLSALREAYPETRIYGNIAGNIARDAVLGGAGVPTISGAVEKAAARGLSALGATGRSALSRAGMTAIEMGAGNAVENSIFGAAQELSEESLGPTALSAEKILAAGGEAGMLGALFGAGLGAGGSLVKSGVKGAGRMAGDLLADHSGDLRKMANRQRWEATGATPKATRIIEDSVGIDEAARVMKKHGLGGETFLDAAANGTTDVIYSESQAAKSSVGRAIGEVHGKSPATVPLGEILDEYDKVAREVAKGQGSEVKVASIEKLKESIASKLVAEQTVAPGTAVKSAEQAMADLRAQPVKIQDLIEQRKVLDGIIYNENGFVKSDRVLDLQKIRGGLEDRIVAGIDTAAKQAGDAETGALLLDLKNDYHILSRIEKAAEKASGRSGMGLAGQVATAVAFGAGGPLAAAATAGVQHVMRTRGNAMAAHVLDKLADLGDAQRAMRRTDLRLTAAAKGLIGEGTGKAVKALPGSSAPYREPARGRTAPSSSEDGTLRNRFARAVEHVSALKANQGAIVQAATSRQIQNAPNISAAMASGATRSIAYLISRLPPTLDRPSLGGRRQSPRQSEAEMQKFVTEYEAVKNPDRVLDNLASGRVKRIEIQALQNTSPELFAELQKRTLEDVIRKEAEGTPLSHEQRLKLGIVFDIPTDPSLEPATMQSLQAGAAESKEEEQKPATRSPRRSDLQTEMNGIDRIETM